MLPIEAIEFAAYGGTNFAKLELLRSDESKQQFYGPISRIGHDALEMTGVINLISKEESILCKQVIISGGITSFLDGYYLINYCNLPAVYGQASGFLKFARNSYEELQNYVHYQVEGLKLAQAYFRIKESLR